MVIQSGIDTRDRLKPIKKFNVLHFLIAILLVLGVFFRFVNIDRKIAWLDECITFVRVFDKQTNQKAVQEIFNHQVITVQDFHNSLQINLDPGVIDGLKNQLVRHPEHPPLYYMLARWWAEQVGNSVATARTVAAFISLFVLPCTYWLCWELFGSLTAWIGVALVAISPIHVLYAQEAREYSLWTVVILLSSAALLRAMRLNTKLSWITYAATLVLGLYSHLFFTLVAIAQGIYVLVTEGFRLSKTLASYLLAAVASVVAFPPWIWIFVTTLTNSSHFQEASSWVAQKPTLLTLVKRWLGNLSRVFIDFGLDESATLRNVLFFIPIILGVLILVAYAIYFLCRETPKRVWLFVLLLLAVPTLALVGVDLILGKKVSGTARYLFPLYVGVQLAVIYLLGNKMTAPLMNSWRQNFWRLVTVAIFTGGVLSCAVSSQAQVWWNKGEAKHLVQVASIVNQSAQPLLVSDAQFSRVVSITQLLRPDVHLQLAIEPNIPEIPGNFSNVFLFSSSDKLRQDKEQEYNLKPLYNKEIQLGKLEKL